ncbi:unnamed protein product [Paramecium pentaurelia]|uniref:Transmembrane protein n=1 Tax=Paramecium pentaurelia TaxID=43138 RepID=A0A8S1XXM5_9CILI|nr:unnamed protein product [Paramecium pentaurelia]
MKFLLISLIILKCISYHDVTLFEVNLNDLIINLHQNEAKSLDLDQARSAILESKNNNSIGCEIIPLHLKLETQELRIIQDINFLETDLNNELNYRQFISMTHINDGMIAITSDLIVYLLKFNYNFLSQHDFHEIGQQFAKIVWKFNLTKLTNAIHFEQDFPKLLYAPSSNVAFLLQNDRAQLFSLAQIESQGSSLSVYEVPSWKKRIYRGYTKEIDGLIFSAVGIDGLDVYIIVEKGLQFIQNIKIFHEYQQINIIDFSIITKSNNDGIYFVFILDKENGLFLCEIQQKEGIIQYEFKQWIEHQNGGISVDTKNGKNVFYGYQQQSKYYLIEYYINLQNGYNFIIRKKQIDSRIIDIDATDEFVIVQGINQHTIIFCNDYDYLSTNDRDQIFKHVGLRDFEFFNQIYKLEGLNDITKEYENDDFFFGITSQTAFLTRFRVQPISIRCLYHPQNSIVGDSFYYKLQYNMTHKNLTGFLVRYTQNVTINIIETYIYENDIEIINVCLFAFSFLLLIILVKTFSWLDQKNKIINKISKLIENMKLDKGYKQDNGPQTGKIDETSVFQIQNQSIIQQ